MKIEKIHEAELFYIGILTERLNETIDAVNTLMEKEDKRLKLQTESLRLVEKLGMLAEEAEPEWPKDGDEYFNISTDGDVVSDIWEDTEFDRDVRDFLGIYKTREDCEEVIKRIKELLNK